MGACFSKCGNYLPGKTDKKVQGGDTPKLSRLQHKESFHGPQTVLTNEHINGQVKTVRGVGDATPTNSDSDRQVVNLFKNEFCLKQN